nr:MAG: hypothetical protein [Hameenlinna totivirus 1]
MSNSDNKQSEGSSNNQCACEPIVEKFDFITVETKAEVIHVEPPTEGEMPKEKKGKKEGESKPPPEHKVTTDEKPPAESAAPSSAPTAEEPPKEKQNEKSKEDKKENGHYGQHSIITTDTVSIDATQCGVAIGQNLITMVSGQAATLGRRCCWENEEYGVQFFDILTWHRNLRQPLTWYTYTNTLWALEAVAHTEKTVVEWSEPSIKSTYNMADYSPFIGANNIPSLSQFSNTIRMASGMSKLVTEGLTTRLDINPHISDRSGFFAAGFFMAAHLDYLEHLGTEPAFPPIPAGVLITADISSHENAAASVAAINKAINCMAMNFERRLLSDGDIKVLILLAMGGSSIIGQPAGTLRTPVTAFVTWPKMDFLVWDKKEVVVPQVFGDGVTAAQVRTSMKGFAALMNAYDDMGTGFIKCASILFCDTMEWPTPGVDRDDVLKDLPDGLLNYLDTILDCYDEDFLTIVRASLVSLKRKRAAEAAASSSEAVRTPELVEVIRAAMIRCGMIGRRGNELYYTVEGIDNDEILGKKKKQPAAESSKSPKAAVVEEPPAPEIRRALIHAMLDTNVLQVPCPRGANPLWDMMKVAKPKDTPNLLTMDDGRSLSGMDSRLQMKTCLIIGGLLSIGASIVLHSINITGRELRLWAKDDPSRSTDLLRQLFQATEGGTVAPYYQMIIGSLQQLTKATIHTDAVAGNETFSGNGFGMVDGDADTTWWEGTWPGAIPYIIEPAAFTWMYRGWCDYWGYFGPQITINFSPDLVLGGADGSEYFSFHRDEPAYLKAATTDDSFLYIPYGVLALNTCIMLTQPVQPWIITIRLAKVTQAGTAEPGPPRYNQFQPLWNAIHGLVIPGTLLTYSWKLNSIIIPGLARGRVNDGEFYYLVNYPSGQVIGKVGWYKDGRVDVPTVPVGGLRFLGKLKNLQSHRDQPGSGAGAEN